MRSVTPHRLSSTAGRKSINQARRFVETAPWHSRAFELTDWLKLAMHRKTVCTCIQITIHMCIYIYIYSDRLSSDVYVFICAPT